MPLIEEVNGSTRRQRPPAPTAGDPSSLPAGMRMDSEGRIQGGGEMNPEVAEAAAQMEAWAQADPEGFQEMMKATMASKEAGDDPETAMKKLEALLASQQQEKMGKLQAAAQAASVAQEGVTLPSSLGSKKVGLDGKVVEDVAGIDITPTPAFVVKTTERANESSGGGIERKVFLNLCTHEALGLPHLKKKLDESGKEVEGWNVPLSVGPRRECSDQKGGAAVVFDCVVHPKVVNDALGDDTGGEKDFLVQLALQYAESKYKHPLDRRYKLPKLAYKSSNPEDPKEVAPQRVRDTSKTPSITEVVSEGGGSSGGGAGAKKGGKAAGKQQPQKQKKKPEAPPAELKKLASRLFLTMRVDSEGGSAHGGFTYEEVEDTIRATSALSGAAEPKGADGSEKEPRLRPNGVDDVDDLPREMVLRVGPLGRHAMAALLAQDEGSSSSSSSSSGSSSSGSGSAAAAAAPSVEVSVYGCFVQLPGHVPLSVVLPYAADVEAEAECVVVPATSELELRVPVDPTPYASSGEPDPGSRPWLLRAALEGGGDGRAQSEEKRMEREAAKARAGGDEATNSASAAEDRFHLNAKPKGGVDPLTGLVNREEAPVEEDEELPEDRFHRDDALSVHYIHQREGDRKEKLQKADKEREERKARKAAGQCEPGEENIDYIDVEDFKPGGRYGPPAVDVAARRDELTGVKFSENQDMVQAKKMVVELASQQQTPSTQLALRPRTATAPVDEKGGSTESRGGDGENRGAPLGLSQESISVASAAGLAPERIANLQSTLWADLLD